MGKLFAAVAEFHTRHGFDQGCDLRSAGPSDSDLNAMASSRLEGIASQLNTMAQELCNGTLAPCIPNDPVLTHDPRLLRTHLILEEVAELILGLARRDEVMVTDGMADSQYVIAGTGVTFGLPVDEAFDEVQRSNMTKEVRAGGDKDVRCRKKGESFVPPDIKRIIKQFKDRLIAEALGGTRATT